MGPNFGDTLNGGTVINVHGEETRLITARLAYAAPELLEALKAVHVALHCNSAGGGDLEKKLNRENPQTVEAVKAAIAKAEGRA